MEDAGEPVSQLAQRGVMALAAAAELVVVTHRLPAEPSRHRVAVWRELRRLGAVTLRQGTWAVPEGEGLDAGFAAVAKAITAAGGQPVALVVADDQASTAQLEALFTEQREAEWAEFRPTSGGQATVAGSGPECRRRSP